MAVDTVLFDLDDTLFDHRYARLAALRTVRALYPKLSQVPLGHLDRTSERILTEVHLSLVLTGKLSLEESRRVRMSRFLAEFGVRIGPAATRRLLRLRQEAYRSHRRPVPGALTLLRHLQRSGRSIVVVSNNLRSEQVEKLRVTGLAPWVNLLVCSEQVGVTKPDPRIFYAALSGAGATPDQAVMVGDSWESDVVGAVRAGIRPVWFHRDDAARPSAPPAGELHDLRPVARAAAVILGRPRPPP